MKTSRIAAIVALVLALAAATPWTWKLHLFPNSGIDDANIFFSYAENLASGNGFTYARNGEPVEGFTSILWTVMCAASFYLGLDELGVFAFAFVLFVTTQFLLLAAIRNAILPTDRNARFLQVIYAALVLSSPSYITWMTITLMDTSLWGFIIAVMTYFLVSPPRSKPTIFIAAMAFGLAPTARPEALLVAPAFLALLWLRLTDTGRKHAVRMCLCLALAFVATAVGLTIFRIQYFGYPFPNTYYAKVSPSLAYNLREGKDYLYRFILSSPAIGALCLVLLCRAASWIGQRMDTMRLRSFTTFFRPPMSAVTAVSLGALTLLAVPVLTGGDHFNMFRFFQPVYPLIVLVGILSGASLSDGSSAHCFVSLQWWRTNLFRGVAVGAVIAYWFFAYSSSFSWSSMRWGSPIAHEFRISEGGMKTGSRINHLFLDSERRPSVGVITAGGIARTYTGRIVDLMGLNNITIAHSAGDRKGQKNHAAFEPEAFFHVEPDILIASPPVPPDTNNCDNVWLKGLLEDSRFTSRWRYGTLSRKGDSESSLSAFVKGCFLDEMLAHSGMDFRDTMIWSNKWVEVTVLPGRQN